MGSDNETEETISVSELATWTFCPHAWALRYLENLVANEEVDRFARGRAAHRRHAAQVFQRRRWLQVVSVLALVLLVGLALAWFLVWR